MALVQIKHRGQHPYKHSSAEIKHTGYASLKDAVNAALAGGGGDVDYVVADIAARDLLTPEAGEVAHVTDASADASVGAGYAGYRYVADTWIMIYEQESLNLTVPADASELSANSAGLDNADSNNTQAILQDFDEAITVNTNLATIGQFRSFAVNTALVIADTNKTILNVSGADIEFTLPAWQQGIQFEFFVTSAHYLRVNAGAGAFVAYLNDISAEGGYFRSNSIGHVIKVKAIRNGTWDVVNLEGTWTFDE